MKMNYSIFDMELEKNALNTNPLAERMRPKKLEDFVGQKHIIGEGKILTRAIQSDKLTSAIFYGPPGTGKTTLAKIIANMTDNTFTSLNAVTSGIKDIKEKIDSAEKNIVFMKRRTILFIDEIHRFNKAQQDALLPYVENGTIILIGATTENPYFEVNSALISRSLIFEFKNINEEDILEVLKKAIFDDDKGFGKEKIIVGEGALEHIVRNCNGDVRKALSALEIGLTTTESNFEGEINFTIEIAEECIQVKKFLYDKNGDNHYDTVSAFIKSMRGSDSDAALFWLAKMLKSGEDPKFIARRIIICASEDVGNADPRALQVAVSAFQALDIIGMPEARIPLAQAVTYICCAPKSNAAYKGINKAYESVDRCNTEVPLHLKDGSYKASKNLKHGEHYIYPHDYPYGYTKQQYLPKGVKLSLYNPKDMGYEAKMKKYMKFLKENK